MARELVVEGAVAPADNKFGTFLGVFTPSILTILGVIMYQRFGWVVGNAGLGGTLAVVLLAHVISLTTGLSVASIATNHTVRTGGNYYIISRSLGLSIGGAIGLALYLALALGVSLYLIGFAEAFIAATDISITGDPKDDVRIIGTVACVAISGLTLWSTAIAMKSQLFVLIAIALSLVSIFLGSGVEFGPQMTEVALGPPPEAPDLTTVFAVFFPAVTGFTAGVGMSGDLKDPKRAIPLGTMAAIGAGLLIYMVLPLWIARHAPVEALVADNNILLRMAWRGELVTLGVFAATLSSALGSILGAPRTLQALAFDGIVPRVLGRGRGEPRVALVVTILIAEAGILLGELELVGAILSMFFLTCYGFLCLACGLERWASPDFRPQFRVPVWISLVGAVACFMVMFQINALAMFGAILLMGVVYAVLKRRQLVLSSGDTWGGVWSAVVRMGLLRLKTSSSREMTRNWRPNMVVTSRERGRADLLDFARAVVGDRGLLTHFHLVPGGRRKPKPDPELEARYPGLFAREQGCEDPFEAIPNVASHYGLFGMETNVVLIGWPRDASTNQRYARMIDRLIELDISVLMLRLDKERAFGKRERLDVWWDGVSPTGQLMLTLVHLLSSSAEWKNARIRVLVPGRPGQDEAIVKRRLDGVITEARVKAEGVLLPPLADAAALPDRVRQESAFADLVVVHALEGTEAQGFVAHNDELLASLGTALLVRPASVFQEAPAIFDLDEGLTAELVEPTVDLGLEVVPQPLVAPALDFAKRLDEAVARFAQTVQAPSLTEETAFLAGVAEGLEHVRQLPRRVARRGGRREAARGLVDWAEQRFGAAATERAQALVEPARAESDGTTVWEARLRQAVLRLQQDLDNAIGALPEAVSVVVESAAFAPSPDDGFAVRWRKRWATLLGRERTTLQVRLQDVGMRLFAGFGAAALPEAVRLVAQRRFDALERARRLVSDVHRCLVNLRAELDQAEEEGVDVERFGDMVRREAESLERVAQGIEARFRQGNEAATSAVRDRVRALRVSMVRRLADPWDPARGVIAPAAASVDLGAEIAGWRARHVAMLGTLEIDVQAAGFAAESRRAVLQMVTRLRREVTQGPIAALGTAAETMRAVAALQTAPEVEAAPAPDPGAPETADPAAAEASESPGDEARYLAAADELRATWTSEYRADPRALVDQLVAGLSRAAERLPSSRLALDERGATEDGQPAPATFAVRRLGQSYLESALVQPAREQLRALPEEIAGAQAVLVDAVRLVAFELEHAMGSEDGEEDVEDLEPALPLAGMLQDRAARLEEARGALEQYLDGVQESLLQTAGQKLLDVRGALTGASGAVTGPGPRVEVPGEQVARGVRRIAARLSGGVDRVRSKVPRRARRAAPVSGGLVDDVLALRAALDPRPEVQAGLPIVYRRVFGRTALETSGLLVGRERELADLRRMVARWRAGAGGPLALVGPPRAGRSSLVNVLGRELLSGANVVRVPSPSGGTPSEDEVFAAVAKAVGAREGQSAEGALRAMPPGAVIVLDELGRWIERAPGGLAALGAWRRIWRRLGERHLFVVTATPWVFGYAEHLADLGTSFLGRVDVGPLAPAELVEGLWLRQQTSEMGLYFEGGGARRADRRGLARTFVASAPRNVGDALDLWRRSVVEVGERRVTLAAPPAPDAEVLRRLPVRWYAGLTAVAFHRSVGAARLARVLRERREDALGLLQDLERAGLVTATGTSTYGLDPVLQPAVLRALEGKGLLG